MRSFVGSGSQRNFLESPEVLRNISLPFVLGIGGKIYLDVKADESNIADRILPPSSATHVLFGAGLQGHDVLLVLGSCDDRFVVRCPSVNHVASPVNGREEQHLPIGVLSRDRWLQLR